MGQINFKPFFFTFSKTWLEFSQYQESSQTNLTENCILLSLNKEELSMMENVFKIIRILERFVSVTAKYLFYYLIS